MNQRQLEVLALEVVERAKTRKPIEDDRVEFKRELPPPTKARQLAGSCNRANGEDLIYIVGVDEADGSVHSSEAIETSDWWAQMTSRFDGPPPDLVSHLNVPIGEGEVVTALLFGTDRAPYVIKSGSGGSPELEVPIRDATGTRSARRHELLRLMAPTSEIPSLLFLEADAEVIWSAATQARSERMEIRGSCRVYVEHVAGSSVLLPEHQMILTITLGDLEFRPNIDFWAARHNAPPPPRFGVHVSQDGVVASGPGSYMFSFRNSVELAHQRNLSALEAVKLDLEVGVAGATRTARASETLKAQFVTPRPAVINIRTVSRWALNSKSTG